MPHPTPDTLPARIFVRLLAIPDDVYFSGAVTGALLDLTNPKNWKLLGAATADECAYRALEMIETYLKSGFCGVVVPYVTLSPPAFTLPCDGSTFPRADYPYLYDAIDPVFQIDSDNFKTPDLRGRFLLGSNATYITGATGGEETHTLTAAEMPTHNHTSNPHTHENAPHSHAEGNALPFLAVPGPEPSALPGAGLTAPATVAILPETSINNPSGGDQPHNNMPPYIALKYAIYYA